MSICKLSITAIEQKTHSDNYNTAIVINQIKTQLTLWGKSTFQAK